MRSIFLAAFAAMLLFFCHSTTAAQPHIDAFNKGYEQFKAKNYKEADRYFTECVRLNPTYITCHYVQGLNREIGVGYRLAIESYNAGLRLAPNHLEMMIGRGRTYGALKMDALGLADLTRAIQLKPDSDEAYYQRARIYLEKNSYERAIENLTQAIKYKPNALRYMLRSDCYDKLGQTDKAITDITSSIIYEKDASYYLKRGDLYLKKKQVQLADADFAKAVAIDPSFRSRVDSSKLIYQIQNSQAEQEKKMTPAEAARSQGFKQMDAGQYDAAIVSYTKAIELEPKNEWGYIYRGRAYSAKGDQTKALADLETGISLKPSAAAGFVSERAGIYYKMGRYPAALQEVNKVAKMNAWDLLLRGRIYARMGKTTEARADLTRALALNKHLTEAQAELDRLR